jgi:DNA-directed RNA polymerase subunit RPC12/RpoP
MPSYDNETQEILCPNCNKKIVLRNSDIYLKREVRCKWCNSVSKFDVPSTTNFRHAVENLAKAEKILDLAIQKVLEKAEIKPK